MRSRPEDERSWPEVGRSRPEVERASEVERSRPEDEKSRTDRGGATVLVVAMAGLLMFVMTGLAAAGGLVTAQRRAQAAADLAVLAAAPAAPSGPDEACTRADEVATANGADLVGCRTDGDDVTVEVSVPGPRVPWRDVRVSAEARAGPG